MAWSRNFSFLIVLLVAFAGSLPVQGPEGPEFAMLEKRLDSASPGEKLSILLQMINRDRFIIQDIEKSHRYAQMALDLARGRNDRRAEGLARQGLAYCQFKNGNIQESLKFYLEGRAAFMSLPDLCAAAVMNFEIGNLFHYCYSDGIRALEFYQKSLDDNEACGNVYGQMKDVNIMGEVHRKMGDYKAAVSAYVRALRLSNRIDTVLARRKRAIILVNLSEMYAQLELYSKSRSYLDQAEAIYRRENLTQEIAGVISGRGDIYRSEGRYSEAMENYRHALEIREKGLDPVYAAADMHKIAETLSLSGRFADATRQFEQTLAFRRKISDYPGTAQTLLAMGVHCRRMGLKPRALPYIQESLKIAQEKGLSKEQLDAWKEMADFMAWKGDREAELRCRKLFEETRNRIQSPKTTAEVMEFLMEYEKEIEIAQAAGGKKRILAYALAILGFLAVVFIAIVLHSGRAKKLAKNAIRQKEHQLDLLKARLGELETPAGRIKYRGSKLSPDLEQVYLKKLITAMEKEKLYLNPDLTLNDLATKFNVNRSYMSQAINHSTGKKFLDFINSFRVDEAKRLIESVDAQNLSILDISLESGFNSKTVFNRIFKKLTGMTPIEYRGACGGNSSPQHQDQTFRRGL